MLLAGLDTNSLLSQNSYWSSPITSGQWPMANGQQHRFSALNDIFYD